MSARLDRLLAIKDEGEVTRSLMAGAVRARRRDRPAWSACPSAPPRRSARSTSTGTATGSRAASRATRSRCSAAFCASPRPSRSSTRRAGSRAPTASQSGAAAAGSTRTLVARARRVPRRRRLLGLARRAGPGPLGAARPGAGRRRERQPVRARDRVRRDRRRQVAVDLPPLGPHEPDRHQHGRRARLRCTEGLGRPAPGRRCCTTSASSRVSNRILDKPAQLTTAEFERVKEHPLFTQWVLERVSCFRRARADRGRPPRAPRRRRLPARPRRPTT